MKPKLDKTENAKLIYLTTSKHYNTRYKIANPYYKPILRLIDYGKLSVNKNPETV